MITANSENKNASEQTDYNPVPTPYFSSSGSRRSFFEEFGSGPLDLFSFGPILPDLSDIREIILEKNKTLIEPGFSLKSDPCITAIVPCYCTLLLYLVIFQAIKSRFLISMVMFLGVETDQVP